MAVKSLRSEPSLLLFHFRHPSLRVFRELEFSSRLDVIDYKHLSTCVEFLRKAEIFGFKRQGLDAHVDTLSVRFSRRLLRWRRDLFPEGNT